MSGMSEFLPTADHVEVRVTCGSADLADAIAERLVAERLAACVHRFPIRSTYRWQGVVERDEEIVLAAITTRRRAPAAAVAVRELHDDDVPGITCVDLVAGTTDYLAWVEAETS